MLRGFLSDRCFKFLSLSFRDPVGRSIRCSFDSASAPRILFGNLARRGWRRGLRLSRCVWSVLCLAGTRQSSVHVSHFPSLTQLSPTYYTDRLSHVRFRFRKFRGELRKFLRDISLTADTTIPLRPNPPRSWKRSTSLTRFRELGRRGTRSSSNSLTSSFVTPLLRNFVEHSTSYGAPGIHSRRPMVTH